MKNRKIVRCLIIVIVLSLMLSTSAFAAGRGCDRHEYRGRSEISQTIGNRALEMKVAAANLKIEQLVRIAQHTRYNDINWLLREVDKIVADVQRFARLVGGTVLCEYTEYYIDGQYVLIDPLRVVNF